MYDITKTALKSREQKALMFQQKLSNLIRNWIKYKWFLCTHTVVSPLTSIAANSPYFSNWLCMGLDRAIIWDHPWFITCKPDC